MANKSNILLAAVAGLAVGVGIGLLLAPEKGSKTRKKIKDKVNDLAGKIEANFPSNLDDLKHAFHKGKEQKANPAAEAPETA